MLNKKELINAIAEESLVNEKEVREVIDGLISVASREVGQGSGVSIPGFGKMFGEQSPERRVRNPKTGVWTTRGPDLVLKFQPSAKLKRGINK